MSFYVYSDSQSLNFPVRKTHMTGWSLHWLCLGVFLHYCLTVCPAKTGFVHQNCSSSLCDVQTGLFNKCWSVPWLMFSCLSLRMASFTAASTNLRLQAYVSSSSSTTFMVNLWSPFKQSSSILLPTAATIHIPRQSKVCEPFISILDEFSFFRCLPLSFYMTKQFTYNSAMLTPSVFLFTFVHLCEERSEENSSVQPKSNFPASKERKGSIQENQASYYSSGSWESLRSITLQLGTSCSTCPPQVNEQLSGDSPCTSWRAGGVEETPTLHLDQHLAQKFTEIIIHPVCKHDI